LSDADGRSPERVVAGRYRLEEVLGRGGMGVVWRAVDTLIERPVAIKELRAPAGAAGVDRDSFVERALREARNSGRLNHPAVVGVHDVVAPADDDDTIYLVMEYVQAPSLADILDREGPLPAHRVAAMGLGILDALDAAHSMGIVHRDIKPANVLIAEGDRVKLTDFGIALAAEDTRLTRSGVIGTHAYLAPECFDAGQAGPASDLWSLGATLFHSVAGRPPFDRDTTTATLRAILFEDLPAPPCEPRLAKVITGLLTRPIDQRLTSDGARRQLQPVAAEPPPPSAPAMGAAPAGPGTGPAPWEAQATGLHRPPPATPMPPPPAVTTPPPYARTQPGAPPPPHATAQPPHSPHPPTVPGPGPRGPGGPGGPGPGGPGPGGPGRPGGPGGPVGPAHMGPMSGGGPAGGPPPRNNKPWLVGGAIAAAAALILVFVAAAGGSGDDDNGGGGGGGGSGPKQALEKLLKASQDQDLDAAKSALCREDLSGDMMDTLVDVKVVSYTIGSVEEKDGYSIVNASVRTEDDEDESDGKVPVVQEDGTWKVCFSKALEDLEDLDIPTTDTTDFSTDVTTTSGCDADQNTASEVADRYVSVAAYSIPDAQLCVYGASVPSSTTEEFGDKYFFYDHSNGDGTYVYTNSDDQTLTVTVTMESDGRYWVTDASIS